MRAKVKNNIDRTSLRYGSSYTMLEMRNKEYEVQEKYKKDDEGFILKYDSTMSFIFSREDLEIIKPNETVTKPELFDPKYLMGNGDI